MDKLTVTAAVAGRRRPLYLLTSHHAVRGPSVVACWHTSCLICISTSQFSDRISATVTAPMVAAATIHMPPYAAAGVGGHGWFSFVGTGRDALPLSQPGYHHCGSGYGGWLSGWDNTSPGPPPHSYVGLGATDGDGERFDSNENDTLITLGWTSHQLDGSNY
jgi:hypothetical protein